MATKFNLEISYHTVSKHALDSVALSSILLVFGLYCTVGVLSVVPSFDFSKLKTTALSPTTWSVNQTSNLRSLPFIDVFVQHLKNCSRLHAVLLITRAWKSVTLCGSLASLNFMISSCLRTSFFSDPWRRFAISNIRCWPLYTAKFLLTFCFQDFVPQP